MNSHYTNEKHTLMLIGLMKKHGIHNIIVSPGTTNISFVGSLQHDDFFNLISAPDERSAAYMACGLSEITGEPVVLSCTGATASRNYIPGLTEAFYRNLPVIAVTSTVSAYRVGHNIPQVIDRGNHLNDIVKCDVHLRPIYSQEDEWNCSISINKALLETKRGTGGPVHINLETVPENLRFDVKTIPCVNMIHRYTKDDEFPLLGGEKIAVFVGNHKSWGQKLIKQVEMFCELYNAIVICDKTSNYPGSYRVDPALLCCQENYTSDCLYLDVLIHIGDTSGAYLKLFPNKVWRVSEDGEVRDSFKKLSDVFEMSETDFFTIINGKKNEKSVAITSQFDRWEEEINRVYKNLPELPFSNMWSAQKLAMAIPSQSCLYLGILNSLRSFNLAHLRNDVFVSSNTGGFGIDGGISTLIGASLSNNKLYFGIFGDLAFFYDMNVLGNRHVGNNVRLMLVNNGSGTEFRHYNHLASMLGDETIPYIAAAGHYGNKSSKLVKDYAEDLGYLYISASNKEEFESCLSLFVDEEYREKSIVFEIFTDSTDESNAYQSLNTILMDSNSKIKKAAKNVLGDSGVKLIKEIIGK